MLLVHRKTQLALSVLCGSTLVACGSEPPTAPGAVPGGASARLAAASQAPGAAGVRSAVLDTDEECARSAGFFCQVQQIHRSGKSHPLLSAGEFAQLAGAASGLLSDVPQLDSAQEVSGAVCLTANQLERQLATLAFNLAANDLGLTTGGGLDEAASLSEPLEIQGATLTSVGDAFDAAKGVANGSLDAEPDEVAALKDVLDGINGNANTPDACEDGGDGGGDGGDGDGNGQGSGVTEIEICHVPPGNPRAAHTLVIFSDAWPAHERHGDRMGPC
jgi:hypothetical protein